MHDVRDRLSDVDCEEATLEEGIPSFSLHDNAQYDAKVEADEGNFECNSIDVYSDRVRHLKESKHWLLDLCPSSRLLRVRR